MNSKIYKNRKYPQRLEVLVISLYNVPVHAPYRLNQSYVRY